jgi:hypothetical protein
MVGCTAAVVVNSVIVVAAAAAHSLPFILYHTKSGPSPLHTRTLHMREGALCPHSAELIPTIHNIPKRSSLSQAAIVV